jgi:hypothetical protein
MGGHLERRLSRLEQEVTPAMRVAYVWWKCPEEETEEQAITQHFPDGVPADVRVVLLRWLTPGEAATDHGSRVTLPAKQAPFGAAMVDATPIDS